MGLFFLVPLRKLMTMTIAIEKGMTKKQIDDALKNLRAKKTKMPDHKKYFGKLNWNGNAKEDCGIVYSHSVR